jgi:hypothetical protein
MDLLSYIPLSSPSKSLFAIHDRRPNSLATTETMHLSQRR